MTRARSSERGAAFVFVVLIMLALLALAHGGLVASLAELSASRAGARQLALRGAAERALREALVHPVGAWMDSLAIWETLDLPLGPLGAMQIEGSIRRLDAESWLVEGRATDAGGRGTRSLRLAWSLDPSSRVRGLSGAVTVPAGAPMTVLGFLDANAPTAEVPPMEAGACDPWRPDLDAHFAARPLSAVATLPDSAAPMLGLLDVDRILELGGPPLTAQGTPEPVEAGGLCLDGQPWVWGDPDQPWRPCGSAMPLRTRAGGLTVEGGVGQGVLVVDGDLTLQDGARYYGMVVVTGVLRLAGGASLEGMVLAGSGVHVEAGAAVRGSVCWAVRALAANRPTLGRFIPLDARRLGPL
jgi:hypothetical protein